MRVERDPLEEWALHCHALGARTILDASGAPPPYDEEEWRSIEVSASNNETELEGRLVSELARAYRVGEDRIALALGAQQADFLVMFSLLSEKDIAAVESPTYVPMVRQAEMVARVQRFSRAAESGYRPDVDEVRRALQAGARMICLTNLHNPTAASMDRDDLERIGEAARRHGAMVLVDEVYREMSYGEAPTAAYVLENGIAVSSVTKLNGLRGLRLGWMIGPPEVAEQVNNVRMFLQYRLPAHSLALALEAVRRREWFRERVRSVADRNLPILRDWAAMEKRLAVRMPDGGLHCLVRLPRGVDDLELSERLLRQHHVAVCPGRLFDAPGCIRVTFSCPSSELEGGLGAISSVLDGMI